MSSLIFYTDPSQALVATDTLAVKPDGTPQMYCSKTHYLPHLKTIIAGTGLGSFSGAWANYVNDRILVRGLRNLDFHTPEGLRALWARMKAELNFPDSITTTVYQFGVSEDDGEIRAYAYRSANDFASETLAHGTHAKPECSFPSEGHIIKNLHPMMIEQRSIQARKPPGERVYIGGECIVTHLTGELCTTTTLFQFDDYEAHLSEIFENFSRPRD